MSRNTQDGLGAIARILCLMENPTGKNCSNDIGATIKIDEETWVFNGLEFETVPRIVK